MADSFECFHGLDFPFIRLSTAHTKEQNPLMPWVIFPPHAGQTATEDAEQEVAGNSLLAAVGVVFLEFIFRVG